MDPESIDAAPSADNGNVPLDVPSEPVVEAAPAAEEPAQPAEPTLYALPDGREVDAETLAREWKDNFMPDYTKKAQELAAFKAPINNQAPENPYKDPAYVPKTYDELIEEAERRALAKVEQREKAVIEARQAVENEVATTLAELKKGDPTLDENALFQHANKYKFGDLRVAHENMKAMGAIAKTVQQVTAKNIAKRADPVSVVPGATGAKSDPAQFATAKDFLRSLSKN